MPEFPIRTVVRDDIFNEMLGEILPEAPQSAEFAHGAEWLLTRFPEYGTHLGNGIWFLPLADEIVTTPPLALYYRFDQEHIWFLAIVLE